MPSKACFKCGVVRPLTEFYKHQKMADGHVNKCKECNKADVRSNRAMNVDHYRNYDKSRDSSPERVAARETYAKGKGKDTVRRCKERYIERNKKARAVHTITGNAIRDGLITKSCCEVCGSKTVHAHHDDYDKPLSVSWLCPKHHKEWHKKNGRGKNID